MRTVIIGGVAGGATAGARLRRLDGEREIVLLERGPHISFANCGLPYYIGGTIRAEDALLLQTPGSFATRYRVDVRVNSPVTAIDPDARLVWVEPLDGSGRYALPYDDLLLATGAEPVRPPLPGIDSERVFTLRNVPDANQIKHFLKTYRPRTAVIAGGGFIGLEMAENLQRAGLTVTVVELAPQLLAPLDFEMAAEVAAYLQRQGVAVLTGEGLKAITPTQNGLALSLSHRTLSADMLLLSVGVRPESSLARAAGIETNGRGYVLVDEHMRTSRPGIYAVGDMVEVVDFVTRRPTAAALAGPANRQGRVAADNMAGYDSTYTGAQGSAILKIFDMTVAVTGINEKLARAAGIDYDQATISAPNHATYYPGAQNLTLKVLWERGTGRLLGGQVVGYEGVDKRADVLATAIRLGGSVTDLTHLELCYAPPFGSAKDPVNVVGYVAENVLTGKVKQLAWHQVDTLPRDGSMTLLDVRTPEERARGSIPGFSLHIPLDELPHRLSLIPRGKPVVVHCHSGLRSYLACRTLSMQGYDCYNLSGGYRLYRIAQAATHPRQEAPLP
ncbi:MAG: FAD-dependent oxidoreductase [Eubacteriales bacterium]